MDFQSFVNTCAVSCAVLSVEKTPDGHCGAIHIVCANQRYREVMGPGYYDGMPYEELVPKDPKFEDFCFRAAHGGERMHAYVPTKALGTWTDQAMIPLAPASERLGYCQFVFEFTKTADPARMALVSLDTAQVAMSATLRLTGTDDFRHSVREVLSDILEFSGAHSCRIILLDAKRGESFTFCEKLLNDKLPEGVPTNTNIPHDIVATWEDTIGVSNAIIVKDEHDMSYLERRNPAWVASMRAYDVRSLVLIPLRRAGTTIGYLYVVNFNVEREVEVKELLELMSFLLGAEIANFLLMRRMEELSMVDQLTGLFNRNAMTNRMHAIMGSPNPGPFGVINLDLNGLKVTNDERGHDAGDALLVEAAELLRKVFHEEDLFRTGGDEFIVLSANIERSVFDEKVARLRHAMHKSGTVSFAIGTYWSDGSCDLRTAYRTADQRMYADKRAYYKTHSRLR